MSGRRGHERYVVANASGSLRVVRDVSIWRDHADQLVATSEAPAAAGELLRLERIVDGETISIQVCVVESRPMLVSGRLRHRLRLRIDQEADGGAPSTGPRTH
jgi:hypothetical protein